MSDRRVQPRFEIVGRLRGSVASLDPLPLVNMSRGGALVRAPWALPLDSLHSIRLQSGAALHETMVRVRHVEPVWNDGAQQYLIGLEIGRAHV